MLSLGLQALNNTGGATMLDKFYKMAYSVDPGSNHVFHVAR